MSRRRKTNYPGSKSFGSELAKEGTITQKKESISTNNLLSTSPSEFGGDGVSFTQVSQSLQFSILTEIVTEGSNQIVQYTSQINQLATQFNKQVVLNNSSDIIEYLNLLINTKSSVSSILSWMSVIASIAHNFVVTLDGQLPEDLIKIMGESLVAIQSAFDAALTSVPKESILGITLGPDQKQVSETKAIISDVFDRLERIKRENEEAKQDWGTVEQNAYERLLEGSIRNVSGKEFLDWLSDLEQEQDV